MPPAKLPWPSAPTTSELEEDYVKLPSPTIFSAPPAELPDVGSKRKERESPTQLPMFKEPAPVSNEATPAPKAGGDVSFLRPPLLTVDTSTMEESDSPLVPRTPANVRSMHRTELHAAVCAGNIALATSLLEEGHAVDPQEEHGFTPLHNASALDKSDVRAALVRLLLTYSADVLRGDNEGFSCLHWAAACGHADVLEQLMAAGAAPELRSIGGESALHREIGRASCRERV